MGRSGRPAGQRRQFTGNGGATGVQQLGGGHGDGREERRQGLPRRQRTGLGVPDTRLRGKVKTFSGHADLDG